MRHEPAREQRGEHEQRRDAREHQHEARDLLLAELLEEDLHRQASADEVFVGRRPILMVVEPASLCWQVGHLADDRSGATWAQQLAPLSQLEQLSKDDGSGLARGLELVNQERRAEGRADAEPLVANDTPANRALNRRVEVTLFVARSPDATASRPQGK